MPLLLQINSLILMLMLLAGAAGEMGGNPAFSSRVILSTPGRFHDGLVDNKVTSRLPVTPIVPQFAGSNDVEAVVGIKSREQATNRNDARPRRRPIIQRAQELSNRKKIGGGLWVVSTGHSCVIPAIAPCIKISKLAGHPNHTHLMQFAGGAGGAPRAQWNRPDDKQEAKPALATGKIDVLTFGHLVAFDGKSHGCDVEDYERWIDYALKHNPKIKFYIQDLWPWLPGPPRGVNLRDFQLKKYEAAMKHSSESVAEVVTQLNVKYPGRVRVLPVGVAMTELVRRVHRNELPGVDSILVPPKDKEGRVGLYRDKIHPTDVVATLEGYVYFACLYRENPLNLKKGVYPDARLDRILREVAWKTVTGHPLSGLKD